MSHAVDPSLLLGVLAVQTSWITADALVEAVKARAAGPDLSVEQILVAAGHLDPLDADVLRPVLEHHLAKHGGDAAGSVDALLAATQALSGLGGTIAYQPIGTDETVAGPPTTADAPGAPLDPAGSPRYRRLRLHARGNIGEVYVARDAELHRDVALKQIRARTADDPASRARFCFEAEVTGGLEHPGIVPVYGLSRDAAGRPSYAMRLIRGESLAQAITAYHDGPGRAVGTGDRLVALQQLIRRFLDVCNAVAYAHSRGIIHRDLKPANIMVGRYGETLVVDWGLARSIDPRAAAAGDGGAAGVEAGEARLETSTGGAPNATVDGSVVGTPAYMAPEQAAGRLDQLGATSDVYSLGATLHQLLTGRAPFKARNLKDLLEQVRAGRFAAPREVDPAVPRVLDAIVRKAMALDPADRYATPLALATDLEHWLADEPTAAAPEGWGARLCRWERRHRAAALAGAATLLAITTMAVAAVVVIAGYQGATRRALAEQVAASASMTQALKAANQAEGRERAAKQGALDEAEKANRVVAFLVSLFEETDPIAAAGRTFGFVGESGRRLTALDVVDRGARALESQLHDRPLVRAAMLDAIGTVYASLGAVDRAAPLLAEALAIRRRDLPADHLDLAASLHSSGWSRLAQLDPASVGLLRQALAIRRGHLAPDDTRLAATQFLLAMAISSYEQGSTAETDDLLAAALATRRKRLGPSSREVGVQLAFMGYLQAMQDQDLKAAPLFIEAARIAVANGEGRLAAMLATYVKAEALLKVLGHKAALPSFARSLEEAERAFGVDHLVTTFFAMTYGDRLLRAHQPADAERQYRKALGGLRNLHAPDAAVGNVVLNLGRSLRDQDRPADAERTFREALAILRGSRPTGAVRGALGQAAEVLAVLLWNEGRRDAEPFDLLAESARVRASHYGADDPRVAGPLARLAHCREAAGQLDPAIAAAAEVARIARLRPDDPLPALRGAEANLARLRALRAAPH